MIKWLKRPNWHTGSALYELSEPVELSVGGFLTDTRYVIVAVSPRAVDHEQPETLCFAANKDGDFFGGFWDCAAEDLEDHTWVQKLNYENGAFEHTQIIGRHDHVRSLNRLFGPKTIRRSYRGPARESSWHGTLLF